MSKLASIILNWIGGGKTPIPIRFLKSVDIPGNAPNSGNNIHILEVKGRLEETNNEELLKEKLFLDDKPFEQNDISKIHIYDTVVKYSNRKLGISCLDNYNNTNNIEIVAGYDSQNLDSASLIKINLNYNYNNDKYFKIIFIDV